MPYLTEQRKEELTRAFRQKWGGLYGNPWSEDNEKIDRSNNVLDFIFELLETELTQALTEKVEEIRGEINNSTKYDLDDDGGCGDPECCGSQGYYINPMKSGNYNKTSDILALPALQLTTKENKND